MKTKPSSVPPRIGVALHKIRQEHKLSLDQVARSSGVSKSMLSQIERDLTNPTIATLWRLTNALGVNIEDLLRGKDRAQGIEHIPANAVPHTSSSDNKCRVRILGPLELAGRVEWYEMSFDPHGALISDPHEPGTMEHLTVIDGKLSVESGSRRQLVAKGETVRYRADQHHAIRNLTAKAARALLVVIV